MYQKKFLKPVFILFLLLIFSQKNFAQIGGRNTFNFLNLTPNARTVGVGGTNISLAHGDVNMFVNNPALLDSAMVGKGSFNFTSFYAGVPHTSLNYVHNSKKIGLLGFGLQYISYGKMIQTDASGNVLGDFSARDFALYASHARTSNNFSVGITTKLVMSGIAGYNAAAFAVDLGGTFKHPTKDLTVGITVKNIGFAFKSYFGKTNMPFDAQIGASYKPKNMPVRFSLTAHHLQRFDIAYNDPNATTTDINTGAETAKTIGFADKFFRHWIVGTEFVLSKNFNLLFGYNHLINRDLRDKNAAGTSGFSAGFRVTVKKIDFAYSRAGFHAAGGRNYLTISLNFKNTFSKKIKEEETTITN